MKKILAIITADHDTQGILLAEALKAAASAEKLQLETRNTLPSSVDDSADSLLLVGGSLPESHKHMRHHLVSGEEVLHDAGKVLRDLADDTDKTDKSSASNKGAIKGSIVAVTSCPTGIAHTFMAAEGLQQAAKTLGYSLRVETQGSVGAETPLTDEEIAAADLVIIAADREVNRQRFSGKRVFACRTKPAINDGQNLIQRAFAEAETQAAPLESTAANEANTASNKTGVNPYKHLMNGVSFMLPFITAGGLLIALGFALGGIYVYEDEHAGTLGQALFTIGANGGFALVVPVLAGYIAFSIADRPGLAPGMIGGMLAAELKAGFLGGIVAGFVAGYAVAWLNKHIRLPRNLQGLKPVLILPLLGTGFVGLVMIFVIGEPVANALAALTQWLESMQGSSAVMLGLLIGSMMAFDMGGPVNKAAYAFATGLIASQVYSPMAAAMVAGMTAPLGAALATRLFANRFSREEKEAGSAAAVLGLAFVTEGAIPFAARDPFRVIPSLMLGSAVAGAISMFVGAQLRVPHGGIFVLPIPNAVTHLGGYVLALVAGTVVTAVMLGLLKKRQTLPTAPDS